MLLRTLVRDLLKLGLNSPEGMAPSGGLPWDGGSGGASSPDIVGSHDLITDTGAVIVTDTGAAISDGT